MYVYVRMYVHEKFSHKFTTIRYGNVQYDRKIDNIRT